VVGSFTPSCKIFVYIYIFFFNVNLSEFGGPVYGRTFVILMFGGLLEGRGHLPPQKHFLHYVYILNFFQC
jgi:hypothetical protein